MSENIEDERMDSASRLAAPAKEDRMRAELEAAHKRILEFENREAACCPEDRTFEEVIASLRRQIADLRGVCGSAVLAQHEAVERAEKAEREANCLLVEKNALMVQRLDQKNTIIRQQKAFAALKEQLDHAGRALMAEEADHAVTRARLDSTQPKSADIAVSQPAGISDTPPGEPTP